MVLDFFPDDLLHLFVVLLQGHYDADVFGSYTDAGADGFQTSGAGRVLSSGHGGGFVVGDDDGDVGVFVDAIQQSRHARVGEGGVADDGYGRMQAGSVYDQAGEYRMLVLEGTDVKTLNRARFIEVLTPLNIVVIVAGGCSMLLMAPLFAASMTEPATLASFFGGLVLCYALVSIGAFASNHVAASLNLTDYRADD